MSRQEQESRILKMVAAMKSKPGLGDALAREQVEMQNEVRGEGGSNSSGNLIEKFAENPFALSRYR